MGVVEVEQQKNLFLGIMCGIVVIPLGCLASRIVLRVPFGSLLFNLLPLILFSLLLICGLLKFTNICVKIFNGFVAFVRGLIMVGLIIGVIQFLTGKELLSPIDTLEEGAMVCLNASVVLSGAFTLMHLISKVLVKSLRFIGGKFVINEVSALGFASTLVSNAPTFGVMYKMDERGVILNSAFAVSASFVFGSHLAFTMAFDGTYLLAMIIGKLVAGVLALFAANYVYKTANKSGI